MSERKKVIVKGPLLSMSGYGYQARNALRALRAYEEFFDIYAINTPWGNTGWMWKESEERQWIDSLIYRTIQTAQANNNQLSFDVSLQVVLPNETEQMAPVNICYTAGTETNKLHPAWMEKSINLDKIIVVSEHSAYAFRTTKHLGTNEQTGEQKEFCVGEHTPIEVVNYPVRKEWLEKSTQNIELNLPYQQNFLVVAQWCPRKNLESLIQAFVREFFDDEVGLVLKTNTAKNSIIDRGITEKRLKELLAPFGKERKCKIHLLHGDLNEEEMKSLYQHPQITALVNFSHGEGFGLPVFEAIVQNLPVITPLWGGVNDFSHFAKREKRTGKVKQVPGVYPVSYDIKPIQKEAVMNNILMEGSMWAFPHESSLRKQMKQVLKTPKEAQTKANKLGKHVRETFTEEKLHKRFAEQVYGEPLELTKDIIKTEQLPNVDFITSVYDADEFIENFLKDITSQSIFDDKCSLILVRPQTSPGVKEKEVIQKFMKKHKNIQLLEPEEDKGIYACWNEAIKNSKAEFISNANVDDRHSSLFAETMASYLTRYEDVDVVYGDSLITQQPNETMENNTSNGRRYYFNDFSRTALLQSNLPHCCPMWRRSLHEKFGYFDENLRSASDWKFWLTCAFGGSKMRKVPEVLSLYYFNPKGVSTNPKNFEWKQKEEKGVFLEFSTRLQDEMLMEQQKQMEQQQVPEGVIL